jgi:murein L,D-transpeptidase YafK
MSRIILRGILKRAGALLVAPACLLSLWACAKIEPLAPHLLPLSKDAMMLLGKKAMDAQAPIFIRIFKEESELEIWKQRDDGRFYHFKTYPICNWSGELGPKLTEGDRQAPEGFYTVSREQMNPDSKFHLALNLGYPNAFDKSQRRTGKFLMIHGKCNSAGCYAMTDALIEEIYAMARESFLGGQETFQVHAFPFRMTEANLVRHSGHPAYGFWKTLKEGYDHFELTRQIPAVAVCNRQYLVNVSFAAGDASRLNPEAACPRYRRAAVDPFRPKTGERFADERIVMPGPKMRSYADANAAQRSGLTTMGGNLPNTSAPSIGFAPQ